MSQFTESEQVFDRLCLQALQYHTEDELRRQSIYSSVLKQYLGKELTLEFIQWEIGLINIIRTNTGKLVSLSLSLYILF